MGQFVAQERVQVHLRNQTGGLDDNESVLGIGHARGPRGNPSPAGLGPAKGGLRRGDLDPDRSWWRQPGPLFEPNQDLFGLASDRFGQPGGPAVLTGHDDRRLGSGQAWRLCPGHEGQEHDQQKQRREPHPSCRSSS
jgi:hypothetical protein